MSARCIELETRLQLSLLVRDRDSRRLSRIHHNAYFLPLQTLEENERSRRDLASELEQVQHALAVATADVALQKEAAACATSYHLL